MTNNFDWSGVHTCTSDIIRNALQGKAPWRSIDRLDVSLVQAVLDEIQCQVDAVTVGADQELRRTGIKCLRALSKKHHMLPSSFHLDLSQLQKDDNKVVTGGAFSDIYRGHYRARPVALKVLRIHDHGELKAENVRKAFCEEVLMWKQFSHPNIQPLFGASEDLFPSRLCLISPWLEHGNIMTFLAQHPHWPRKNFLIDVASGMHYLHRMNPSVIHADIRGANILVDNVFCCRLADFGISLVAETQMPGSFTRSRGNIRWHPVEMVETSLFELNHMPSLDIYSFGCSVIEIYTGKPPYWNLNEGAVIKKLLLRELPEQPPADVLPPTLWTSIVVPCLSSFPTARPSAEEILIVLQVQVFLGKHFEEPDPTTMSVAECSAAGAKNAELFQAASRRAVREARKMRPYFLSARPPERY